MQGCALKWEITQFDKTTNTFPEYKSQIGFAPYWPVPAEKTWGNAIRRMSFSRTDPNSVYLTTGTPYHNTDDAFDMPYVIRYIGNDFDAMEPGSLEHYDNTGNPQWENIYTRLGWWQ